MIHLSKLFMALSVPLIGSMCGIGAFVVLSTLSSSANQTYTQLLSGHLVWQDLLKDGEQSALAFGLIFAVSVHLALSRFLARLPDSVADAMRMLYALSAAPVLVWVASLCHTSGIRSMTYLFAGSGLCAVTTLYGFLLGARCRRTISAERSFRLLSEHVFALVLSMFSGFGFAMLAGRLLNLELLAENSLPPLLAVLAVPCVLASSYTLHGFSEQESARWRWKRKIFFFAQIGLPLLFLDLLPPPARSGISSVKPTPALYALVLLMAGACLVEMACRSLKAKPSDFFSGFSPLALIAVLFFIKAPLITKEGQYPIDFYHLGEYLLPWKLWANWGHIPYCLKVARERRSRSPRL